MSKPSSDRPIFHLPISLTKKSVQAEDFICSANDDPNARSQLPIEMYSTSKRTHRQNNRIIDISNSSRPVPFKRKPTKNQSKKRVNESVKSPSKRPTRRLEENKRKRSPNNKTLSPNTHTKKKLDTKRSYREKKLKKKHPGKKTPRNTLKKNKHKKHKLKINKSDIFAHRLTFNYYASKIQALVRGFLVRQRLKFFKILNISQKNTELSHFTSDIERLQTLRDQDVQDIHAIIKNFKQSPQIEKALIGIIDRRYQTLAEVLHKEERHSPDPSPFPPLLFNKNFPLSADKQTEEPQPPLIRQRLDLPLQPSTPESDDSLLGHFRSGRSSYTPDNLPERPQAPLSNLQSDDEEDVDIEWVTQIASTVPPDSVLRISEIMVQELLKGCMDDYTAIVPAAQYLDLLFEKLNVSEVNINLSKDIYKDPLKRLKIIQETEIGFLAETEFIDYPAVVPEITYLKIESAFRSEAQHIHNKLIFDTINEILQQFRPYGTDGPPFPWESRSPVLRNTHKSISEIWPTAQQTIVNWEHIRAGKIHAESEEALCTLREEGLAQLLGEEITCGEKTWTNYSFEEQQVHLDVADLVLEELIAEVSIYKN